MILLLRLRHRNICLQILATFIDVDCPLSCVQVYNLPHAKKVQTVNVEISLGTHGLWCHGCLHTRILNIAEAIALPIRGIQETFFLISSQKNCCGHSLELSHWAMPVSIHSICFCREIRKISILFFEEKTKNFIP